LQGKWFLGLAAILGGLLGAVALTIYATLPGYLNGRIREDLGRMVRLAGESMDQARAQGSDLQVLATRLGRETGLRITFIAPDGVVLGESDVQQTELSRVENHLSRPEVQQALREGLGYDIRRSVTVDTDLLYAAVPRADRSVARVAMSLARVHATTGRVTRSVAWTSLGVALLALPIVYLLSRRVTGPLEAMSAMARRAADGDFSQRAPERGGAELSELGTALNRMSDQLNQRLQELASEKAELQATLSTMVEGVLVVDAESRVRLVNASLQRQFDLGAPAIGRTALEAFRNVSLQKLIDQVLSDQPVSAQEMTFFGDEERVFDVTAARLRNGGSRPRGAVLVLHEITRIKRLERVRREFVANASHELRTPLAVIRGYVETLLEEPPPDPETSRRFLDTMDRNARRLETLLQDLLSISELESQQARLNYEAVALADLAGDVAQELARLAEQRNIALSIELPTDLPPAHADAQRLHQVFTNLIENALKYTSAGGWVRVTAEAQGGELVVCVSDNGPGIAAEHLTRIFERFYRVDKARSREVGGTGLGLSIVKHIVQAHHGRVWAESRIGEGSRFFFTVPAA
jgi:two-component system phosphate regulon sensor histidine kinase PhoR